MPRTAPISRSVLSDQVRDRLLQAILTGRYPPGARIVETRVAQELGTSQAPVREALRDLEAIGVVDISPYRGARVRHPSRAELLEAFAVRLELEALGARLALPRITDADLDELQGCLEDMHRAVRDGDNHAEALADARFHGRILEIGGNQTLERVWSYLEPYSRTYVTILVPGIDPARIADLHDPIVAALRAGDADRTVDALRTHFATIEEMLGSLWDAAEPPPAAAAPSRTPTRRARRRRIRATRRLVATA